MIPRRSRLLATAAVCGWLLGAAPGCDGAGGPADPAADAGGDVDDDADGDPEPGADDDEDTPPDPAGAADEAPAPAPPVVPHRPIRPPVPMAPPSPPPPEEPAEPPGPPEPPEEVAKRIAEVFPRIVRAPAPLAAADRDVAEKRTAKALELKAYDEGLAAIAKDGDAYLRSVGPEGGDPLTLYRAGAGKLRYGDRTTLSVARRHRGDAAALLRRALAGDLPEGVRGDAELDLGRVLLRTAGGDAEVLREAVAHLRNATQALLASGERVTAGQAAADALLALTAGGRDEEAREFAAAVRASTEDFGPGLTEHVRTLVRKAETGAGAKFPDLADTSDADGRPVVWKDLRGQPFVLHFFHAGLTTGRATNEREIEQVLRPLHDRLAPRGLRMIGVSMDHELSKERIQEIRRNWDEWSIKERIQDGSRDTVRLFVEEQGVAWPWLWDGLWQRNPVSLALGGCGASEPHAILVDAEGTIRWRGDGPFRGLAEAAEKLLAR